MQKTEDRNKTQLGKAGKQTNKQTTTAATTETTKTKASKKPRKTKNSNNRKSDALPTPTHFCKGFFTSSHR